MLARMREGGDPSFRRLVHCSYMDSRFRGNDIRAVNTLGGWYKLRNSCAV